MRNISTKVSWQVRRNSQMHVLYNFNNKGQFNRTENTGPITDFIDGNATIHQTINSNIVQARWTSVLRNNLLFDVSGSFLHGDEHGRPQDDVEPGSIPTFDLVRREHRLPRQLPASAGHACQRPLEPDVSRRIPRSQGRLSVHVSQGVRHVDRRILHTRHPDSAVSCVTVCRTR